MGQKQGKAEKGGRKEPAAVTKKGSTSKAGETNQKPSLESRIDPGALKNLQEATHFDQVEVSKLYDVFHSLAPNGKVDKDTFKKGLEKLQSFGLKNIEGTPFAERLFHLLDVNGDGAVDLQEFISGLSMLCKGTVEEKLALSFKAYDIDGNGFISKEELALMFKSAWIAGFRALCASHGNEEQLSMEDLNEFSEEMANLFAENAFDTLDTNGDGQLSFEEFKEFALAEPKITATLNGFKKEVNVTFW
jgi:Ca2+-binding EF-hand superfamily protein